MKLSALFGIEQPDFVTVTGGGGKTSLLTCLASELRDKGRTLLTTTTKMRYPDAFDGEVIITASYMWLLNCLVKQDRDLYYFAERCIEDQLKLKPLKLWQRPGRSLWQPGAAESLFTLREII